jgi:NAD(P)-dependent dehydrogenase (short-subunit alcohol dehydrogenase family)
MDLHLAGKRALITGASKGIGRASAEILAEEGCDVVLVARDRATLDAAADAIRAKRQVQVETISADLSQQAEVERVAAEAGALDILVNNAGAIPPGNLLAVDNDRLRAAWDLKVFGFISLTRAVYEALRTRRGVIVNVIGAAGETFDPGYIAGVAGNAALMAFTRALGRGGHKDGIRAVAINPGPVATQRMEMLYRHRAAQELGDAERWRELTANMPYGRPAEPEEIAAAVAFLASDDASFITASTFLVDGGISGAYVTPL